MKKQTRSLLQEINDLIPQRDMHFFVESKAVQAIASVQNLITLIESNYSKDDASDLIKRLFNSMKSGDQEKFRRGVRYIREAEEK
jgi:hypothetical protein